MLPQRAIHCSKQPRAFVGVVDREALPMVAVPHISKKTGGILVEMQKSAAFGIEDPEPLLEKNAAPPQVFNQIAERREGSRIGVLHHLLPGHLTHDDIPTRAQ